MLFKLYLTKVSIAFLNQHSTLQCLYSLYNSLIIYKYSLTAALGCVCVRLCQGVTSFCKLRKCEKINRNYSLILCVQFKITRISYRFFFSFHPSPPPSPAKYSLVQKHSVAWSGFCLSAQHICKTTPGAQSQQQETEEHGIRCEKLIFWFDWSVPVKQSDILGLYWITWTQRYSFLLLLCSFSIFCIPQQRNEMEGPDFSLDNVILRQGGFCALFHILCVEVCRWDKTVVSVALVFSKPDSALYYQSCCPARANRV